MGIIIAYMQADMPKYRFSKSEHKRFYQEKVFMRPKL